MSPEPGLLCLPPHQHTALSVSLTSSFPLPIDLIRVWPGPAGGLFDMLLCWTGPRCLPEKELCIGSADRLTQPLPASDPLLTGSPVYQGWKKCKQSGSVHPGTEHRTSFILSPMLLPDSPLLTSGWLYFEIKKKISPWWWTEVTWKHIPSSMSERQIVSVLLAGGGEQYLQLSGVCICLPGTTTPLESA